MIFLLLMCIVWTRGADDICKELFISDTITSLTVYAQRPVTVVFEESPTTSIQLLGAFPNVVVDNADGNVVLYESQFSLDNHTSPWASLDNCRDIAETIDTLKRAEDEAEADMNMADLGGNAAAAGAVALVGAVSLRQTVLASILVGMMQLWTTWALDWDANAVLAFGSESYYSGGLWKVHPEKSLPLFGKHAGSMVIRGPADLRIRLAIVQGSNVYNVRPGLQTDVAQDCSNQTGEGICNDECVKWTWAKQANSTAGSCHCVRIGVLSTDIEADPYGVECEITYSVGGEEIEANTTARTATTDPPPATFEPWSTTPPSTEFPRTAEALTRTGPGTAPLQSSAPDVQASRVPETPTLGEFASHPLTKSRSTDDATTVLTRQVGAGTSMLDDGTATRESGLPALPADGMPGGSATRGQPTCREVRQSTCLYGVEKDGICDCDPGFTEGAEANTCVPIPTIVQRLPKVTSSAAFRVPILLFEPICDDPAKQARPLLVGAVLLKPRDPISVNERDLELRVKSKHTELTRGSPDAEKAMVCLRVLGMTDSLRALASLDECDEGVGANVQDDVPECAAIDMDEPTSRDTCNTHIRYAEALVASCQGSLHHYVLNKLRACQLRCPDAQQDNVCTAPSKPTKIVFVHRGVRRVTPDTNICREKTADSLVCAHVDDVGVYGLNLVSEKNLVSEPLIPVALVAVAAGLLCCSYLGAGVLVVMAVLRGRKPKQVKTVVVGTSSATTSRSNSQHTISSSIGTEMQSSHVSTYSAPPLFDSTEYGSAPPPVGYDSVPMPTTSDYTAPPSSKGSLANAKSDYSRPPVPLFLQEAGYDSVPMIAPDSQSTSSSATQSSATQSSTNSNAATRGDPRHELRDLQWGDLVLGEMVGEGSFGKVYKATLGTETVAVKQMEMPDDPAERVGVLAEFERECNTMRTLPAHRNVLSLRGVCKEPLALISEFCAGGSLDQYVKRRRPAFRKLVVMLRDIAAGLNHLHSHSIVHRDLAARNLLMTDKRVIKVADFGLSRDTKKDGYTTAASVGPVKWMAPESISTGSFHRSSDVWSYGVVVWEMIAARKPFNDLTGGAAAVAIVGRQLRLERPADDRCTDEIWALVQRCWALEPTQRPTTKDILHALSTIIANEAR